MGKITYVLTTVDHDGSHTQLAQETKADSSRIYCGKTRLRISDTQTVVTTPPVVTQSQEGLLVDFPGASPALLDFSPPPHYGPKLPLADHTAIAAMAAGVTDFKHGLDEGIGYVNEQIEQLELFKGRTAKKKAAKLTSMSVFSFLCQGFIKGLVRYLSEGRRPAACSSQSV
jgi:hypothetical protein